jgi:hypothetical protein
MTGNTLTQNPITGTNAYANSAYGTPQQGFWGNTGGFGTPFGYTTQPFQQQVPGLFNQQQVPGLFNQQQVPGLFNQQQVPGQFAQQVPGLFNQQQVPGQFSPYGMLAAQTIQQPGVYGQQVNPWQAGFGQQFGMQGIQGIQNAILQTTPPQVLNTILQTTPPQVLPFILNALACQQACQQVLQQNPQAIQGINPQAITQAFFGTMQNQQVPYGIGGFGGAQTQYGGVQPQWLQGACVGCMPGQQQWGSPIGFQGQGGFGQFQPQQPWSNTTYGTW